MNGNCVNFELRELEKSSRLKPEVNTQTHTGQMKISVTVTQRWLDSRSFRLEFNYISRQDDTHASSWQCMAHISYIPSEHPSFVLWSGKPRTARVFSKDKLEMSWHELYIHYNVHMVGGNRSSEPWCWSFSLCLPLFTNIWNCISRVMLLGVFLCVLISFPFAIRKTNLIHEYWVQNSVHQTTFH